MSRVAGRASTGTRPNAAGSPSPGSTDVIGARIGAQIVDLVLMFVQTVAVAVGLSIIFRTRTPGAVQGFVGVAAMTLPLYGGLLEGFWNGQTVGKRLLGIHVVDRRGEPPSLGKAILRNLPAVVLFSWVTTAVALAAMLLTDRNQRLFDLLADTYVVRG